MSKPSRKKPKPTSAEALARGFAAATMANLRWAKTTPAQKSAHIKKMNAARAAKKAAS